MKFKAIISVLLSVVMLGSTATLFASAAEDAGEKTYNYVAFGDSIAAGYGLSSNSETLTGDPALVLTEDLIANPVQDAYAAVFGRYLDELGAEKGFSAKTTNLSTTAYRAQDVEKTILQEGYKGEIATYILEGFIGRGASAPLAKYHDIFERYLPEADLVSVQLGGNDIVMSVMVPMTNSDNPVILAMAYSMMLTLFGCDYETSLGAGLMVINNSKDSITCDQVIEAAEYLGNVANNREQLVDESANNVKKVVEAVKSVNNTADIALLGMFDPYGNSLCYDGQIYNLCTVVKNVFKRAAEEACNAELDVTDEVEVVSADEAEQETEKLTVCTKIMKQIQKSVEQGKQTAKEKLNKLMAIVSDEIAYPLQYLILGKSTEPQMLLLNNKLSVIAKETGAIYVDTYSISNEKNLDPHPDAKGHKEIAELMKAALGKLIADKMSDTEPEPEPEPVAHKPGDVNGDGKVDVNDVTLLQYYLADMETLDDAQKAAADITGDGVINIEDVTRIQYILADLYTEE